jgi:hypothetical protein
MVSASTLWKVRWARILPFVALGITSVLMIIAAKQEVELCAIYTRHSDTPQAFQAPARLFVQLLNGPSFYFTVWTGSFEAFGLYFSDVGRLPAIVLFWYGVGWALDRRLSGTRAPFVGSRLVRVILYGVLLAVSCLFLGIILEALRSHRLFPSVLWFYIVHVGMRSSALKFYVLLLWAFAFVFYFGWKMVIALTSRPRTASNKLNTGDFPHTSHTSRAPWV